jgi:multidrug efflux system membrane fusion protein
MDSTPPTKPNPKSPDRAWLGRVVKWSIFASALVLSFVVCYFYENFPRTDDASVTANIVGIAPRVSGPITHIAVDDNQFVKAGDLLFEIDPLPYQDTVDQTTAQEIQTKALLNRLLPLETAHAVTKEQVDEATASEKGAMAALSTAKYNLEACRVVAPFDGFITNLNISNGAYAHAAGEVITLVDVRNWYVIANFRESALRHIKPGMVAAVYLMTDPNHKYRGEVMGIGRGVVPEEAPQLSGLPDVKRELNWVRLAQRFPVRIRLDVAPTEPGLRVGATAIVTILGHDAGK